MIDLFAKILPYSNFAPVHTSTFKDKSLIRFQDLRKIQYSHEKLLLAFGAVIPIYRPCLGLAHSKNFTHYLHAYTFIMSNQKSFQPALHLLLKATVINYRSVSLFFIYVIDP